MPRLILVSLFVSLVYSGCVQPGNFSATVAERTLSAPPAEHGIIVHHVESPFQSDTAQIKVLLPDNFSPRGFYSVVYVLPVEAGEENRWGDGLKEIKEHHLHNKFGAIFVAPTFS